jgi:hypothetical protein
VRGPGPAPTATRDRRTERPASDAHDGRRPSPTHRTSGLVRRLLERGHCSSAKSARSRVFDRHLGAEAGLGGAS